MRIRLVLSIAVSSWILASSSSAAEFTPVGHTVAIPVNLPGRPSGSVECRASVGPTIAVTALAFRPDGKMLAVGGYREVVLWDLPAGRIVQRVATIGQVGAVLFLPDGKTLLVGEGTPGVSGLVRGLTLPGGAEAFRFDAPKDLPCSLALSADGKLLAAGGAYRQAHVWNLEQQKLLATLEGHTGWIFHVGFNGDGKWLTTSSADYTVQLWNTADWTAGPKLTEAQPARGAIVHPDGIQVLVAAGGPLGGSLRFRKLDAPPFRRPLALGSGIPLGMAGPSKSGRVYVPCRDKTVKVFDVKKNGSLVATLTGHLDWVDSVAFSADDKLIASGSADGTVKLWSGQDHRLLATLVQFQPREDGWLAVTPLGYYATSSAGAVRWSDDKIPPDRLTAWLQSPELVGKTIAGEKVKPPVVKR